MRQRWWQQLYVQVLVAIAAGVLLGLFWPDVGAAMKPLGDAFIKLVKMIIAPVIFLTVVAGMAQMRDLRHLGRLGLKSLIYFEVLTTVALVIGLLVANVLQPGAGMNVDPAQLNPESVAAYRSAAEAQSTTAFLLDIIPRSFVSAFVDGNLLQVLLLALLFGCALALAGDSARPVVELLDGFSRVLFGMVGLIMRLAPIGAFGAMAFTIGKFGVETLVSLGALMLGMYATCLAFVVIVLGTVARLSGFSLWAFIKYIRGELLLVLGTSSSESALPRLMRRLEQLGCDRTVVGLVVPTGYSFNLDGTCIYLTLAAVFIAQALNIELSLTQQLLLLGVLLLTSKGAAGVTGSGFVTLAATLAALGGQVPVEGVALILGVDRFMSEARALTNLVGNGVATLVIARWEGLRDDSRLQAALRRGPDDDPH